MVNLISIIGGIGMKGRKKIAIVLSIIILVGNLLFNPIEAKAESNIEPQMLNSENINDRMSVFEGERDVVEVESVCLDKTQASLNVGQNITLVATINPIVATNKEVAWSSSNTKIATVDNMGKVTAVGVGTATIMVATVNGGYKANCSVTVKKLPIPTSVKAASSSYKSIDVSWGVVTGASGYELYRATSSTGTYALIATTTEPSYNNTGLKTNSTYYYKNRAYTIGTVKMYSGFSTVVNSKTIPSVPASVKAVSSSYKSINTRWGAVTGASGYEVYRAISGSGTYTLITTTTATSYNNTGLKTNSTYYYKVRAYTKVGTVKVYSSFSTVVNSKPIPSAPISVKTVSSSYNSISVSWGAVTGASRYEVYRARSSTGTYALIATTTEPSYNNAGLTTNSTYYYKIRAYTTVGSIKIFSDFSIVVSSKPIPSIPVSVKAVSASYDSVNISWGAVTGASRYEVYRATSSTGTYTFITTITTTSYDDTGLITNNTYYYKVIACTLVGETSVYSGFSSEVSQIPMLAPTSVSLNKTSVILGVGETTVLIATILPTNVPNKSIKWTSSNNTIAKVDSYGKVIAVGIGNAIITATTVDGNKTANCAITVHKNYKSEFQKLGFVFQSDTTALYTKNGMEVGLVKRDGFWQLATKKWGDSYESLFESSISVIWDKYIAWDNLIYIDYALEDYGSSFKSPYIQAFGKDGKLIVYIFETTKIKP